MLCSFRCRELTERVLEQTGGSLARSSAFSGIAEQFGTALDRTHHYLRNLHNDKSLHSDADVQNRVNRSEPHALSEVLSGAFYHVLVRMYNELREQYQRAKAPDADLVAAPEEQYVQERVERALPRKRARPSVADFSKALFVASERLKRTLLRGLDYLPPGVVTFTDLARAVLASDQASHPESARQRQWLCDEFIQRGIADSTDTLSVRTNFADPAVHHLNLEELLASDYVAYSFANKHRDLLRIPDEVTFEVRPRLDVTKLYWHRDGKQEVRECLFKVAWSEIETNGEIPGLPAKRRFAAGTTLAVEWLPEPRIRALLTSSRSNAERADTTQMIQRLVDEDLLRIGDSALGPMGRPLGSVIAADTTGESLRIRSAGRMLHVTSER